MPIREEEDPIEPDEQHDVDVCSNCDEDVDSCNCWSCPVGHLTTEGSCSNCDACYDHCECASCNRCDRQATETCSACGNCPTHCYCYYCNAEETNTTSRVCRNCENCEECGCSASCDATNWFPSRDPRDAQPTPTPAPSAPPIPPTPRVVPEDPEIVFVNNPLTFHEESNAKVRRIAMPNRSKRFISVEIEVATMPTGRKELRKVLDKWSASGVHDGSLPSTGFEINTAPASGDMFTKQIYELGEALTAGKATATVVCGLHCHVDARDFHYFDMRRLVLLYSKIEPALYRLVAPSRRDNRYCIPCGENLKATVLKSAHPKEVKKNLFRTVYGSAPSPQLNKKYGAPKKKYATSRYSALNIHSWFYRGTIECRMHHGSVNPKAIHSWGVLWARLMDLALLMSEQKINALPSDPIVALLEAAKLIPDVHTWIINRILYFTKREELPPTTRIRGFAITPQELRAMRLPEMVLDDTKEDN